MRTHRFLWRVLRNLLGATSRPSFCTYLVDYRCNARCAMCDSWKSPRGTEMTVDEVSLAFSKVGPLDAVRLTGGEPFLRNDLPEIADRILNASDPSVLHVTTNGSFPSRVEAFCRQVDAPRRLRVMVSLDGLASVHDENRGPAVTFASAMETIGRLVALGPQCVTVSANHTIISRRALGDHEELREKLDALGVDLQWVLAYEDSAMYGAGRRGTRAEDLIGRPGYPLHRELDAKEALEFVEKQISGPRRFRDRWLQVAKSYYLAGLRDRLAGVANPRPRPKCVALRSHLRLLPDGSVTVCQFNTGIIGNLLLHSLEEIWSGATAVEERAWVDACRGCWAECEVVPNAIYSGDIWRGVLKERWA